MSKIILETIGSISKKEILGTVEKEFCNNAFVLENIYPFPGYYHNTVPDKAVLNPGSMFLVTRKRHLEEVIMRKTKVVIEQLGKEFNAAIGIVPVFKENRSVIRLKKVESYEDMIKIIDFYRKAGIEFSKYRNIAPYEEIIKIRKYFILNELEEGLFEDLETKGMYYFSIPKHLTWNQFEKMTIDLKRNFPANKFDAALGAIYRKNCLLDVIRIYDTEADSSRVKVIRDKYDKAM